MHSPIISVIIPVHNVGLYLEKCLQSILNQTFTDIEIIIVNDGSTDESLEIIEKYALLDSRLVVINKRNEGVVIARKIGLENAKGAYIFYLDGDDFIADNALYLLYMKAANQQADLIVGGMDIIDSKTSRIPERLCEGIWNNQDYLISLLTGKSNSLWGKLIEKTLCKNIYIIDVKVGEDLIQILQIANKANKIYVIDLPLYHYVYRETSVTNTSNLKRKAIHEIECIQALEQLRKKISFDKVVTLYMRYYSLRRIYNALRYSSDMKEYRKFIWLYIRKHFFTSGKVYNLVFSLEKKVFIVLHIAYFWPSSIRVLELYKEKYKSDKNES